jgi:Putative auto-transporter adhesin, head GIN domain
MSGFLKMYVAIAVLSLLFSCAKIDGAGPVVVKEISVNEFTRFTNEVPSANVYFETGPVRKLEIEAQQNIINVIKTEVFNGELILSVKPDTHIDRHQPINIYIKAPELNGMYTFNGNIEVMEMWKAETLSLGIGGSGKIAIRNLQARKLTGRIEGSGFSGRSQLNIAGSGFMDMGNFQSDSVYAKISGSGDVKVAVKDFLNADISGSGNIMYRGNPVIQSKVSGSGTVGKF